MTKDLVALYEDLLGRCQEVLGLPDAHATRSRLYTLLLHRPLDARVHAVLDEFGVGASYARTHLLSIGSWPSDVQDAMRAGLPYQDARRIASLDDRERHEVLRLFYDRTDDPSRKASLAARSRERELRHQTMARSLSVDRDGWVPPSERPTREPLPLSDTLVYRAVDTVAGEEALPPAAIEGLLAAYTVVGGAVVDPMAGSGAVALAAHKLGRWSWSGDRQPRYPFIRAVDAADGPGLKAVLSARIDTVNLVLLHPPSVEHRRRDAVALFEVDYPSWLAELTRTALTLTRRGGNVAVVVRPWRQRGRVQLLTDVVSDALERNGHSVVGYHVLVEASGRGEWHVVVGKARP